MRKSAVSGTHYAASQSCCAYLDTCVSLYLSICRYLNVHSWLQDILPEDLFPPISFSINERADEDMPYTEPKKTEIVTEAAEKPHRVTAKAKAKNTSTDTSQKSGNAGSMQAPKEHRTDSASQHRVKQQRQSKQGKPGSPQNGDTSNSKAADSVGEGVG